MAIDVACFICFLMCAPNSYMNLLQFFSLTFAPNYSRILNNSKCEWIWQIPNSVNNICALIKFKPMVHSDKLKEIPFKIQLHVIQFSLFFCLSHHHPGLNHPKVGYEWDLHRSTILGFEVSITFSIAIIFLM